ncbi:MAG: DUF2207 domain-containing protein [Ruminococcaceae bacterium]|nr:DUF2207 domain-containing protein [Oscillospiraceae bacterium]
MKQFCPKCGKWYDVSGNVCPICRSQLLIPNSNTNQSQTTIQPHQIQNPPPIPQEINKINKKGNVMIIIGIILSVIYFFLFAISFDYGYKVFPILFFIGIILGVILFILGVISLDKYNKYVAEHRRKYQEEYHKYYISQMPDNPLVECPYCHSRKVYKISTSGRVGSVLIAGIASSKIGK